MRKIKPYFLYVLVIVCTTSTGCAFFPKNITLETVGAASMPGKKPEEPGLALSVQDLREGNRWRVGTAGLFTPVRTTTRISRWVKNSLWSDIEAAGYSKKSKPVAEINIKIKEIYAKLWVSFLNTYVTLIVEVSENGRILTTEEMCTSTTSFCLFNTEGTYKDALEYTLGEWKKGHLTYIMSYIKIKPSKKTGKAAPGKDKKRKKHDQAAKPVVKKPEKEKKPSGKKTENKPRKPGNGKETPNGKNGKKSPEKKPGKKPVKKGK